jgi:hypothetical protein
MTASVEKDFRLGTLPVLVPTKLKTPLVLRRNGVLVRRVGIESTHLSLNCSSKSTDNSVHSHLASQPLSVPTDLQTIVDAWPALSPEIRAAVLAIIKSAKKSKKV